MPIPPTAQDRSRQPVRRSVPLGVIAALPGEGRCLAARRLAPQAQAQLAPRVRLCLSGLGQTRAGRTAQNLIDDGAAALVSWGVAGALDPAFAPGDVILPKSVIGPGGRSWNTDAFWRLRLRQRIAPMGRVSGQSLYSVDNVVDKVSAKEALFAKVCAGAVDNESAAIAEIAQRNGVPFVAIRVIVDRSCDSLPSSALSAIDDRGGLHPFSLINALVRQPGQFASLLQLRRQFAAARRTLTLIARATGPELLAP